MFRDVHCKSWGPVKCYRGSEQLVKPSRTPPSLTNVLQVLPKRHSFPPPLPLPFPILSLFWSFCVRVENFFLSTKE